MKRTKNFLMSTAAGLALSATGVVAQTSTDDPVVNTPSGQLKIEQKEPNVFVEVPDPDVTVDQRAPQVTVQQPQPEITVQQPKPTVNVKQQAPIITVEQAQPTVNVRIPEPVITIQMPEPDVNVSQDDPNVRVDNPRPVVKFVRPEPKIVFEESDPDVRVENSDEADVQINKSAEPKINIEQADAKVDIREAGEADVSVSTADAKVKVVEGAEADVNVDQAEAQINIEKMNERDQKALSDAPGMNDDDVNRALKVFAEYEVTDLVGQEVIGADGDDIGEVENLARKEDRIVAILSVGGFLGLGEHQVAMPLERFDIQNGQLHLSRFSEDDLERLAEWRDERGEYLDPRDQIGDHF